MKSVIGLGGTRQNGRGRRSRTQALVIALVLIASVVTASGAVMATHAGDVRAVGPVSADNGYPIWYRDAHGTEVELCLEFTNPLCGFLPGAIPNEGAPISFPGNFPGEAFWWSAESAIDNGTQSALLVMAVEAAFASGEVPTPGDQISFGRVRIRLDGLIPDANYTVTHPYGTTIVTAEPDGTVFVTEDIGSLTTPADFSLALDSPVLDGLLEWDPLVLPAPPAGYLGDPALAHTVIGSPTGNNLFSVQGPGLPVAFQSDQFFIMGKRAVTSGVETLRAVYVNPTPPGASDYLEVFAKSRPGQTIHVSGVGIGTVEMRGSGDVYYAKILVSGAAPAEITATNDTDGTSWTAPVTDLVTITRAEYDVDSLILTVEASSSDGVSVLTANPGGELTAGSLSVTLPAAPLDVTVTSAGGGSDTEPVRLVGNDFGSLAVVAVASASPATAIPGQTVTLDGTGSTGDITSYLWEQLSGTAVALATPLAATATFVAPGVTESLLFQLTVTGAAGSDSASVTVEIVAGQPVVANAGADQSAIVGTTVTLDGSGSTGASTYQWAQIGGTPSVTISNESSAVATFTMPVVTATPLVFQLTAGNGTATSTDTVNITQVADVITIARAELRTRNGQLRVDGSVSVSSVPNVVSIYVGDGLPGRSGALIGTATVDPATGTFSFRQGTGVTLPNRTVDLVSSRGGFLDEAPVTVRN